MHLVPGQCRFQLVDVFGAGACSGNPLAVVFDADDLSGEQMLTVTRWLNLSETTFVLRPRTTAADYRVRIFTLDREMPFAGHPTLGTCHAWLAAGGRPRDAGTVVQDCDAGLVKVRQHGSRLAFAAPPLLRAGPVDEGLICEIAAYLAIDREIIHDAQWGDNGPGWVIVLLDSAERVLSLQPPASYPRRIDLGIVGLYPPGSPCAIEVRAVFSDHTGAVREDPVTGSLNASVAQWLLGNGRLRAPYVAAQGTRLGRRGRVHITADPTGAVWVGGDCQTLFFGNNTVLPA
jgi:PhzF family phenazine biosynthesis protein